MSRIKTFLIGRHPDCDLILDDHSVSRRHAEVVFAPGGNYYVTDRNSTGGTFVYNNAAWHSIGQAFVNATDRLRFGEHEIAASRLEFLRALITGHEGAGNAGAQSTTPGGHTPDDGLDPGKGLKFDPKTGEVIEKS